jgi:hypothetical protein
MSNEIVVENVPDEFKIFTQMYFIQDFVVTDNFYFVSYVEEDDLGEEIKRIAAFDLDFNLMWDNEYVSKWYLDIVYWNNDGIVLQIYEEESSELSHYLLISNNGETIHNIDSIDRVEIHNGSAYFVQLNTVSNDYNVTKIEGLDIVELSDSISFSSNVRYLDISIVIVQMNDDNNIVVDMIDYSGKPLFNETYSNGEDIYPLYNGFLVDDEQNSLIEVRNSVGELVWDVKNLKGSIQGSRIIDGNLSLLEGNQVLTISPTGKIISREDRVFDVNIPVEDKFYNDFQIRKTYTLNESTTLIQVIVPHDVQISGLHKVVVLNDNEEKMNIGGESTLVNVEYVNEDYIYLYEYGLAFDNTPGTKKLHILTYDGNIEFQYEVISYCFDLDMVDYYYYFDGNSIIKAYLPTYLSDEYRD